MIIAGAEGPIAQSMVWLATHVAPCCPGAARIIYEPPPMCEPWCQHTDTAPVLLAKRRGTCFSIVTFEVARLRLDGADTRLDAIPDRKDGKIVPYSWHAGVFLRGAFIDVTQQIIDHPGRCVSTCGGHRS